jgi:hypothetical protein
MPVFDCFGTDPARTELQDTKRAAGSYLTTPISVQPLALANLESVLEALFS